MNGDCFSTKITLLSKNSKQSLLYPGERLKDWDERTGNAAPEDVSTGKESEFMGFDFVLFVDWKLRNTGSEERGMQEEVTVLLRTGMSRTEVCGRDSMGQVAAAICRNGATVARSELEGPAKGRQWWGDK